MSNRRIGPRLVLAIATLGLSLVVGALGIQDAPPPQPPGETPDQRQQKSEAIERACARAKSEFDAAVIREGETRAARDLAPDDSGKKGEARNAHDARMKAQRKYCDCLRRAHAKAKLPLSEDARKLCDEVGEASGRAPGGPLLPPAAAPATESIGALQEQPVDPVEMGPCADAAKEYKRARAKANELSHDLKSPAYRRAADRLVRAAKGYIWCAEKHGGTVPPELQQLKTDIAVNPLWGGEAVYGHPCSREWQAYQDLFIEDNLTPRLWGGLSRDWLSRSVTTARQNLCDCMRQRAPADYQRYCVPAGYPPITPTRTPGPSPTPSPSFVQLLLPRPGTTANVAFSGIVHTTGSPDPHPASASTGGVPWCRRVVASQVLTFPTVTPTSFTMLFSNLPEALTCAGPPNGPVDCEGRFAGLYGQPGESVVRAVGVTFPNGRVQGRLEVNSAAAPFSGNFSGMLVQP